MYYSGYDDHSSHQDRLEQLLNYSAADGKFSINATVFKRMIKKLKKQGFDVQLVKESEPSMCVVTVNWHNAFDGNVHSTSKTTLIVFPERSILKSGLAMLSSCTLMQPEQRQSQKIK